MVLGRKTTFICEIEYIIDSGWYVVLSKAKINFCWSNNIFLLNRVGPAYITSDVILDFGLEG